MRSAIRGISQGIFQKAQPLPILPLPMNTVLKNKLSSSTHQITSSLTELKTMSYPMKSSNVSKPTSLFIFRGSKLLLTQEMKLPDDNHSFLKSCSLTRRFPFVHEGMSHVAAEISSSQAVPSAYQFRDLIELMQHWPLALTEPAGKARQILEWDKAHRFCGECGSETKPGKDEFCKMCSKMECARLFYPKIMPVVMVGVERGDEILMARSPHFPPDVFGLIAGFVEPGETVEQAVKREVYEETKLEIKNLRYFSSQSWPRPNELVMGFRAEYKSGKIVCDPKEIEQAAFYRANALPKSFPGNNSILNKLLADFRSRHEKEIEDALIDQTNLNPPTRKFK